MKNTKIKKINPSSIEHFSPDKSGKKSLHYSYDNFKKINGEHPFQERVPGAYVNYKVRTRHGGKTMFFNFDLAKEMGLISKDHPHQVNKELDQIILETFGLMIINEYDIIHKTPIPQKDIREHEYMATRYLQLQHPDKKGTTSGDGRSLWNGCFRAKGHSWDISSSGTGATRLSPATAIENKFFKTGDPSVSYGCGCADPYDGISAAIMSEIFHRSGIPTERTLAIIDYGKGLSINVRAGKNLIRPSHFFNHLKQGNWERLKAVADYTIDRQIENGTFPSNLKNPYDHFLKSTAENFAKAAARFEREYIFCWMGWDGDNILCDGGIIDYGSVRQFGLFHHKYRFDDVDRFSTNLIEQRREARYIIQTFAQIVDFIKTKEKKNIKSFKNHPCLEEFDSIFENYRREYLLKQLGINEQDAKNLLESIPNKIKDFEKIFYYFERQTTIRGPIRVSDGINRFAIYSMRDIMRELPSAYLSKFEPIESKHFLEIIKSKYASKRTLRVTRAKDKKIKLFQSLYMEIINELCRLSGKSHQHLLIEINTRSSVINRIDRITGDSIIHLANKMIKERHELNSEEFHHLYHQIVHNQVLRPEYQELLEKNLDPYLKRKSEKIGKEKKSIFSMPLKERKIFNRMGEIIKRFREGL